MTNEEVTKNIWKNSVSNYVCIALRIVLGLVMFRMLYQGLTKEEFGYWSLLWSLFGYGILLDFGLGFAAMKRVAELSVEHKWEELSKVLSTIFFLYLGVAAVICLGVFLGADLLIDLFKISEGKEVEFKQVLIIFFCGMGIIFPFGIFPEMLIGLQRIALANVIFSAGIIGNAVALYFALTHGWGMKTYMVIGLLAGFLPCLVSAVYALRILPHVKIRPKHFSWEMVHGTVKFSIFVYIATISGLLLTRTDQLVLSTALAVSAVALYQAGAKIAEMFGAVAAQLPETFSPAAAHSNAKGDKEYLQKLLVNGTRFSVMIATPLYFLCAFYMEPLLRIITGDKVPPSETFWIGQVLLLWAYTTCITQSVPKRIFMVCGHEKRLMWLSLGEAFTNLILSVGLVLYFKNVVCVAVGSLIATTIFGWFFLWPWAAKEANISGLSLARIVIVPSLLACLPLVAFILLGKYAPWDAENAGLVSFLAQSTLAGVIGAIGLWKWALSNEERAVVSAKVGRIFNRTSLI